MNASTAKYRRIPKQQRSQEKVDRILETTAQLLEEVPWDEITTKSILERSSVSPPTFYAYFEDCDAVLATLGLQFIQEGQELMNELVGEGSRFGSWEKATDAVVMSFAEWFRERVGLRALWFSGRLDNRVHDADRLGNHELACSFQKLLELNGAEGVPDHAYGFSIEMLDKGIEYAFSESLDGDDRILREVGIAIGSYLRVYLAAD